MEDVISQLTRIKDLFTPEHMAILEKMCDVWRAQVTDNANMEYFYLGRRSVYQDLKRKLETDIKQVQQELENAQRQTEEDNL